MFRLNNQKFYRMRILKNILLLVSILNCYIGNSQCENPIKRTEINQKMMIWGYFSEEGTKLYVAEVTKGGKVFTCRFLHSQSSYTMEFSSCGGIDFDAEFCTAKVMKNVGGKFKKGSTFNFKIFEPSTDCAFSNPSTVIVTFPDNKRYLGVMKEIDSLYEITFQHSLSIYEIDKKTLKVVSKTKGSYHVGDQVKLEFAQGVVIN